MAHRAPSHPVWQFSSTGNQSFGMQDGRPEGKDGTLLRRWAVLKGYSLRTTATTVGSSFQVHQHRQFAADTLPPPPPLPCRHHSC